MVLPEYVSHIHPDKVVGDDSTGLEGRWIKMIKIYIILNTTPHPPDASPQHQNEHNVCPLNVQKARGLRTPTKHPPALHHR